MFIILAIILLVGMTLTELKVKRPPVRLAIVFGLVILMVAMWAFREITRPPLTNLALYSRVFSGLMRELSDLADNGESNILRERLHKLRDELPQAVYDYSHLADLANQMQFIRESSGVSTNEK